mgnify:CR=1 FL=1
MARERKKFLLRIPPELYDLYEAWAADEFRSVNAQMEAVLFDAARRRDIPVGPGRGSAAGSLVCYCIRITDIDPIRHNLLFERFLNPDRLSMPDIDIDFCFERRGEIIEYVIEKYGEDCVSQIITFGTMAARAVRSSRKSSMPSSSGCVRTADCAGSWSPLPRSMGYPMMFVAKW